MASAPSQEALCSAATRAFLQKDYAASLLGIQKGLELAKDDARSGRTRDTQVLARLLVLRFTAMVTVYTNAWVRARVVHALPSREATEASTEHVTVREALEAPASHLYRQLWYETLEALFAMPAPPYPDTLDPPEDIHALIVRMPGTLLTSAILAALRLDAYAASGPAYARTDSAERAASARNTCEWYFAALLRPEGQAVERTGGTYERVLRLYTLQVLGVHLHDWDYARDFVGYSSLPGAKKMALFAELDDQRHDVDTRAKRERDAVHQAHQQYEEEKRRRAQVSQHRPPAEGVPGPVASTRDALTSAPEPASLSTAAVKPESAPTSATSASEPVPIHPMPERKTGAPLQRTASIHGRKGGRTTHATPPDTSEPAYDSHAAQRAHMTAYLARRTPDDPPSHPAPPSMRTYVRHVLFSRQRYRLYLALMVLAAALFMLPRVAPRFRNTVWMRVAAQRLLETLRMYVCRAYRTHPRGTQVTYL